jgi:hypothetical protein
MEIVEVEIEVDDLRQYWRSERDAPGLSDTVERFARRSHPR